MIVLLPAAGNLFIYLRRDFMIPETSVDWKAFEYKYSNNPQRVFENLAYCLFCYEFNQKNGIFRYFNQPHIETNPIQVDEQLIGFQAKYYADSVSMSGKEKDLKEAVEGAARSYPGITTLYFYISREFSPSSKKDMIEPSYKINVEKAAQNLNIKIEWRVRSNMEVQLMQDSRLTICRNVFFQTDSAVQSCCENLDKHKADLFGNINTSMVYKENEIILDHNMLDIESFLVSDNQILIVDGEAGSGKSALIKRVIENFSDETAFLAFRSIDMDVDDKLRFLSLHGVLKIDEVLGVYKDADFRIVYIDAVEKYFSMENQKTFEEILQIFIKAGWKLIFTIRTTYKESFHNTLLNKVNVQQYHVVPIHHNKLLELSDTYGFVLPEDKKLLELIGAPFYLNLYLSLDDLEDETSVILNREIFENKIWEDIIRNNRKRKNNMPTRRENVLLFITMEMLKNENYQYEIQSNDDHDAFGDLEKAGILNQTNDARKYYYSHDVYEELAANHIFTQQYNMNSGADKFFAKFRTSLRVRKLFRGWLTYFVTTDGHKDIIFKILECEEVDKIWKEEVLLTVITKEHLKDIYYRIISDMADGNYAMLKRIAFLINICCRVAEHREIYFNRGSLMPFRLSKPSGYAWKELFMYIFAHKESICWDKEMASVVIEVLDSWTKHIENKKEENTALAGKIGLFLLEYISNDKDLRYELKDEKIDKLQDILCNSAWMIKDELSDIFQTVLDASKGDDVDACYAKINSNVYRMYSELAERAVTDIYHYGQIPFAMPEMTIRFMETMWISQGQLPVYRSIDIDSYFGIDSHLSNKYYPASAYKTPIINLLQNNQDAAIDFLICFCNKAGENYLKSNLNIDYKECMKIMIYVKGQVIEQTVSDRLWKMYRGTHVGSDLLVSLLMGFETWLLNVVKNSDANVVIDFCRDILIKSENVMLTAVIVSIAEAYPEKMIDIVCDFLKTKEIFHFDSYRFVSERQASFLLHGDNIFEEERREANKLPHRQKRLEDIILQYQTDKNEISEEEYSVQLQKIYKAIDDATKDIDTWQTSDKYAYYRMDLRQYKKVVNVEPDGKGNNMCMVMPDFTEDMEELSKESRAVSDYHFQYMDLQLWSDYKFNGNEKFKEYDKYANISIVLKELSELWGFLCNYNSRSNSESKDQSFLFHRYLSIVPYTCTVLLRDFENDLTDGYRNLCRDIIFEFGYLFSEISDYEFGQTGNGIEAIALGLILLINGENTKTADNENPLYLLLKLVLKDWSDDSRIIKQVANAIWKQSPTDGWKLVYIFSLLADEYEIQIMKHRELSLDDFLESYQHNIEQVLMKDSIGLADIDFTRLSGAVTFVVISFVSVDMKEAFKIVEMTKDKTIKVTFGKKYDGREERRNLIGYTLNFIVWFADVLLYCDDLERKVMIESFMERADIVTNENVRELLKWLIIDQEVYRKTDEFWNIWELMKPKMIELGNKGMRDYYTNSNVPFGEDRVIVTYLFANTSWRKDVHKCDLLSKERAAFFTDFVEKSRSVKAVFYALAKMLNTVGMETYNEIGIEWIYKLIMKDSECRVQFYDYTLYYLEEYIGSFVAHHRTEFRENTGLLQKIQAVLEYLINQGSQIAYFLGEEI